MRTIAVVLMLASGCALYNGGSSEGSNGSGSSGSSAGFTLTLDHSVGAEGIVAGVDADQQGGLWIAYVTADVSCTVDGTVTLVHWDPTTRTRLATFTYVDSTDSASGLALVNDQIWLNRISYCATAAADIEIIDPTTGAIVGTAPASQETDDLAAFGTGKVLYSDRENTVYTVDTTGYGFTSSFATPVMYTTQMGVAWQPGQIWVASWDDGSGYVFDESGTPLGSAAFPAVIGLPQQTSATALSLAFDRGQLLVAMNDQLFWLDIVAP